MKTYPQKVWIYLAAQQLLIAGSGWVLLNSIRFLFGRTIHRGQDPMHWIDLFLVTLVSVLVALISLRIFSRATQREVQSLGIGFSKQRLIEFFLGFGIFSLLLGAPSFIGILNGSLKIETSVFHEFTLSEVFNLLAIAGIGLLINSFYEEITSRAVPLKILANYNAVFAVIISAVLFATIHFVDEPIKIGRFLFLAYGGVLLAFCYSLTGNIWFASGVHTATNWAETWNAGLWHLGSLVKTSGSYPPIGEIFEIGYFLSLLVVGVLVWRKYRRHFHVNLELGDK